VKRQWLQVALDSLCGQEVEAKVSTHSAGLWRWRSDHTASRSITHLPSSPSLRANGVKPTRAKANTDETNVIVGIVMRRQDLGGLEPWAELVGTGGAKETEKPLAALPSSASKQAIREARQLQTRKLRHNGSSVHAVGAPEPQSQAFPAHHMIIP
jgi:hypothetical protein